MSTAADRMAPPARSLRAIVVVPARDEAERIERCLSALARQRGVAHASYELIVVLDGCRDDTRERLHAAAAHSPSLRLRTVELSSPVGVGRARREGMDLACARLLQVGRPDGLIASTDADSVVAEDWLCAQLELARLGAQAIGGRIELCAEEAKLLSEQALRERARGREERTREVLAADRHAEAPSEHHQFSGASLALTAATYRRCGGLPVRAALEDEALEHELRIRGVAIHRSAQVRVRTSARTGGRAPRGLAQDLARTDWRARRSYEAAQFPLPLLLAEKRASIALVLPSREVAATIGPIAEQAVRLRALGLLDEVLVVDARSQDGSARIAERAGLRVVQEDELSPELGPTRGKGDAMWRGLRATGSELVAFADTDTEDFAEHFLLGLLGPLVCEPAVRLVKGSFRRPFRTQDASAPHGGGRVTELMARPLLNLHAPELAVFVQPLAGETAGRRELLERIPFSAGYGVEIAMLIDAWRLVGLDGLAQVDLGVRQNRHQSLRELSAMAYAVLVAAQSRFLGADFADAHACGSIALPDAEGGTLLQTRRVTIEERPPLIELDGIGFEQDRTIRASAGDAADASAVLEGRPTEVGDGGDLRPATA
ncbi:MAG TPA: glucosyl-3-phosphoglycerate synthase [Solirubrobacteraceae bacterium]|jgi:glycosyltransferase involved in cell wall biosynthesis|nr:glucosyl-3-phosphoglycerate synthase [Solirubrobacteraceae bacterium]